MLKNYNGYNCYICSGNNGRSWDRAEQQFKGAVNVYADHIEFVITKIGSQIGNGERKIGDILTFQYKDIRECAREGVIITLQMADLSTVHLFKDGDIFGSRAIVNQIRKANHS